MKGLRFLLYLKLTNLPASFKDAGRRRAPGSRDTDLITHSAEGGTGLMLLSAPLVPKATGRRAQEKAAHP